MSGAGTHHSGRSGGGTTNRVRMSIHANGLKNVAGAFKGTSDPFAVVTLLGSSPTEAPTVLGKTEVIKNSLSPKWTTHFDLDYDISKNTRINIGIWDEVRKSTNKPMGSALFEVGEVLGARGNTKAKKVRSGGTLYVRIIPAPQETFKLHLNLRGIKLKNTEGMFGKSDPFFVISAKVEAAGGITWEPVYRSKPIMNDLNPNWPPFSLDLSRLCDGDVNKPVLFEIWDWEKSGKHNAMGKFETTVNGLVSAAIAGADGGQARGIDTSRAFQAMKKGKNYGQIVVTTAKLEGLSPSSQSTTPSMGGAAAAAAVAAPAPPSSQSLIPPPAARPDAPSSVPAFSQALGRPPPSLQSTATAVSAAAAMSNLHVSPSTSAPSAPTPYGNLPPPMVPPPVATPAYDTKPSLKPTFVDYLTGGCELELSIAIDFTGSNGDPRKPGTLHYIHRDGQLNDYEKAITAVGGILSKYDSDQKFPCFGFGAKYGGVIQHSFQIGGRSELDGISGVLDAYRNVFRTGLTMSGPTVFAEVINYAAAAARSKQDAARAIGQQAYRILLILSDGAVTDIEQTKRAISAASNAPLSIVIVGIGNADFSAMQHLDDFLSTSSSGRDIVQFVQFSQHAHDRSSLTRATLEEIPDQLVDYFYSNRIKPLPPISGSQLSLYPDEPTDEDIDLSIEVSPEGEINLTNSATMIYQYDDTKYNRMSDYSAVVPMPPPSAPSVPPPPPQQQQLKPVVFHVQVPPGIFPGQQLKIQHPITRKDMIVTVPQGVGPGGQFAVQY